MRFRDPTLTFGLLLDEWLTFMGGLGRSPTTMARYRGVIAHQLKPTLGDVPLERLRTKAFDDLYWDLVGSVSRQKVDHEDPTSGT